MDLPKLKSERMMGSQAWSFIPESLLRNDINLSIRIALTHCFKTLFEDEPEISRMRCAQEFLGSLKQLFDFSAKTGLIMPIDYHNKSHQLVYSYYGHFKVWIFSRPLWNPLFPPQMYRPYYVGTTQTRQFDSTYPVTPKSPPPTYAAATNQYRIVEKVCDHCTKNKIDEKLSDYGAGFKAGYKYRLTATKADCTKSKKVNINPSASLDKPSKRHILVQPQIQPNKSARCEWPTITQDFWPIGNDRVNDLIRKHGPFETWYASSEKPAPPASTLPTPSFVLRQGSSSTALMSGSDSNIFSIDKNSTSTKPTSQSSSLGSLYDE